VQKLKGSHELLDYFLLPWGEALPTSCPEAWGTKEEVRPESAFSATQASSQSSVRSPASVEQCGESHC